MTHSKRRHMKGETTEGTKETTHTFFFQYTEHLDIKIETIFRKVDEK